MDLMVRRWLQGASAAINGLDHYPLYHAHVMAVPDRYTFLAQKIAQHPASRERIL